MNFRSNSKPPNCQEKLFKTKVKARSTVKRQQGSKCTFLRGVALGKGFHNAFTHIAKGSSKGEDLTVLVWKLHPVGTGVMKQNLEQYGLRGDDVAVAEIFWPVMLSGEVFLLLVALCFFFSFQPLHNIDDGHCTSGHRHSTA